MRHSLFYRLRVVPFLLAVSVFWAGLANAADRLALVVGNSAYDGIVQLKTPVRDAQEVASTLKGLGFEVFLVTDARKEDLAAEIDHFARSADAADAKNVLFYFSGHAVQLDGENYLIPTDAALQTADAIARETVSLGEVVLSLEDPERSTLIFLDASRNNPLPAEVSWKGPAGLAKREAGVGTFVAFATQPNNVALDSADGGSFFTRALLTHMPTAEISISDMMIRVRNDVTDNTDGRQTPWDQSSLRSQFYFKPVPAGAGLTEADYEMLASLPPNVRARMLDLMRRARIDVDTRQVGDIALARQVAALNVDVTDAAAPEPRSDASAPAPEGGVRIIGLGPQELKALRDARMRSGRDDEDGFVITRADVAGVLGVEEDALRTGEERSRDALLAQRYAELDLARFEPARAVPVLQASSRIDGTRPDIEDLAAAGLSSETRLPDLEGKELARAVQTELARLGCYRMTIDGDFGKGSRLSLVRYYGNKQILADSLEPSNVLLSVLRAEQEVVCAVSQIADQRVAQVARSVRILREEKTQIERQREKLGVGTTVRRDDGTEVPVTNIRPVFR